jgi:hypothetical protein
MVSPYAQRRIQYGMGTLYKQACITVSHDPILIRYFKDRPVRILDYPKGFTRNARKL